MITDVITVIALFWISLVLVIMASTSHMMFIKTQARNFAYLKRAQIISGKCDERLVLLHQQSESFNRLFSQIEEMCINDPSIVCRRDCPHCKGGRK
jgi:hypothetical protein